MYFYKLLANLNVILLPKKLLINSLKSTLFIHNIDYIYNSLINYLLFYADVALRVKFWQLLLVWLSSE